MNKGFSFFKVLFSKKEVVSTFDEPINMTNELPVIKNFGVLVIGCVPEVKLNNLILEAFANTKPVILSNGKLSTAAQNLKKLENNVASYQRERPVLVFSLCETEGCRFMAGKVVKNYFVPKIMGIENTKPKNIMRLRRVFLF